VAFYDSNKTGTLVSRIMTDVEGVRNLIGTGLVEFIGGLLTAAIALVVLFKISPQMTGLAFTFVVSFALAANKAFGTIRPIFRERGKLNADVTGRLTESLGGVRVCEGIPRRIPRGRSIFHRRATLAGQRAQDAHRHLGHGTLVHGAAGSGRHGDHVCGAHRIMSGALTVGGFFSYTLFLGFLVAPIIQIVAIGTQLRKLWRAWSALARS